MQFRCTFASCVAWRCLTLTKRDFIVLAVLVSPCVGFAVTGNTAGAKQVLRRHLGGDQKRSKALSHTRKASGRPRISKKFHVFSRWFGWFLFDRFYRPTSNFFLTFLACPKLSECFLFACLDRFGRYHVTKSAWYVFDVCMMCVSKVCVFVTSCICESVRWVVFFVFSFDDSTWHLRGDFWGVWQLSLRGLSSPVTSSALDEIRRETSHDILRNKKKHVETAFWTIVFEVKWMNRIIFFEN